jgi:hypothetical protein
MVTLLVTIQVAFTPISKVLSYYVNPSNTTTARLYVIGDIVNTNFAAGATIQNAQFNTAWSISINYSKWCN